MALLIPSPGISVLSGSDRPPRFFPGIRRTNLKFSVCSGVKDFKHEGLRSMDGYNYEDITRWCLYEQVKQSEPAPFPSIKAKDDEGKKHDYYVNMGYAIRTIREEFPELFNRELSFDIYRDDIVFKDPLNTFSGIDNYKSIFWALRFHGRILFKALWVDIVSVWQPMENMIMVRFIVHGVPRIPWESRGRFDGTSEYKLDKDGKIYEHKVHNIALNGPKKFEVLPVDLLIQSIGCPSTPKPTYFEFTSYPMTDIVALNVSVINRFLISEADLQ